MDLFSPGLEEGKAYSSVKGNTELKVLGAIFSSFELSHEVGDIGLLLFIEVLQGDGGIVQGTNPRFP